MFQFLHYKSTASSNYINVTNLCSDGFRRVQIILWSSIGGTALIAALIFLYVRCDNYECQGPILFKCVRCWL